MKRILIFFVIFNFSLTSRISAQNNKDETIKTMIFEFYTAYSEVWSINPPLPFDVFENKLEPIIEKFCTSELKDEANKWLEDGHDLLTNDWGINVTSLKTMTIKKDSTINNNFLVTYTTTNSDAYGNPIEQDVLLKISVVYENKSYKINKVN